MGESAPAGNTFFYHGNSVLYKATSKSISNSLNLSFNSPDEFFSFLVNAGIYLDDLCPEPVNRLEETERERSRQASIESLSNRLSLYSPHTIVCVMKGIESHVRTAITKGRLENVDFYSLPFPSYKSHEEVYVKKLGKIIKQKL